MRSLDNSIVAERKLKCFYVLFG
nr:hypothetical protein [Ureaplasma parvum]